MRITIHFFLLCVSLCSIAPRPVAASRALTIFSTFREQECGLDGAPCCSTSYREPYCKFGQVCVQPPPETKEEDSDSGPGSEPGPNPFKATQSIGTSSPGRCKRCGTEGNPCCPGDQCFGILKCIDDLSLTASKSNPKCR